MTVDELKAAIERRGYAVDVRYYEEHTVEFRISAGERTANRAYTLEDLSQVQLSTHDFVESMLYTFAQGQCHCQHECGYPLLRETKNTRDRETLAYRSAWEGPQSKIVVECPKCQQYVQDDSVQEIIDVL